ncbi:MAG: hypothetical protein IT304_09905 [Dehalococcoidia bacterium]|nr:hypothetical protein [Dehalococcoidia bacterium]
MPATTVTPTITPTTDPSITPWPERFTDPARICPQQRREGASPDVAP